MDRLVFFMEVMVFCDQLRAEEDERFGKQVTGVTYCSFEDRGSD